MERQAIKTQKNTTRVDSARVKSARLNASTTSPLLGLQQSIGNQAVQRLINSPYIQAKLQVSTPDDPFEQEAGRVADRVMRMADPGPVSSCCGCSAAGHVQRLCTECEAKKHQDDEHPGEMVHRKTEPSPDRDELQDDSSVATNINALNGGGSALPETTRTFFESRFRADFSQVRVHTGAIAAEAARSINAKAFTLGPNIAFGSGQYAPESNHGKHLLAHELAHTIQQGASRPSFARPGTATVSQQNISPTIYGKQIQRDPDKTITGGKLKPDSCSSSASARGSTAKDAPKIDLSLSKSPCACLIVIHNNEENARKTAELMHQHCTYNLALLNSGAATRCVDLPGHGTADFDPNGFFAPEIAEQCLADEALCENFLTTKSGSKDKSEIDQFVQIQFFLAIKKCSDSFSLPIIALHNNTIAETADYRKKRIDKDVAGLKPDIIKGDKKDDDKKTKPLTDLLKSKLGVDAEKGLAETAGQTNIFRWCRSSELSRCHIGNPKQPDQVIWVTNKDDYERLSKTNVNVVLQDDPARVGKESKTDLSTLFLELKDRMGAKVAKEITQLFNEWQNYFDLYNAKLKEMMELIGKGISADSVANLRLMVLQGMLAFYVKEMVARADAMTAAVKEKEKFSHLHYVNIETPIESLKDQTDAGRQANYEFIVGALRTLDLHCCGGKEAEAETKVKEGLVVPPATTKAKPSKAKK